jgi:hypothetical protein
MEEESRETELSNVIRIDDERVRWMERLSLAQNSERFSPRLIYWTLPLLSWLSQSIDAGRSQSEAASRA